MEFDGSFNEGLAPDKIVKPSISGFVRLLLVNSITNNLMQLGFGEDDFADGGSDKLVDAIVAWGDEKTIWDRVQAHYDAGADHVCIQPLRSDGAGPDLRLLEAYAPAKNAAE